jgi:hypothetical protein
MGRCSRMVQLFWGRGNAGPSASTASRVASFSASRLLCHVFNASQNSKQALDNHQLGWSLGLVCQTCRRNVARAYHCARSAPTSGPRVVRRQSAPPARSVHLCPLGSPLRLYPALDALQMNPAGRGRGWMCRGRGRSGQTRRPTWSRDGTRRESHSCLATLAMARLCQTCLKFHPSSEKPHQAGRDAHLGARMDEASRSTSAL